MGCFGGFQVSHRVQPLEDHEIVLLQRFELRAGDEPEAGLLDLLPEGGLVGADVLESPLWRLALDALRIPVEVAKKDDAALAQRVAHRAHKGDWILDCAKGMQSVGWNGEQQRRALQRSGGSKSGGGYEGSGGHCKRQRRA